MDGNGRWAKERGLRRIDGHAAGEDAIGAAVDAAMKAGVSWLTLFAFSTENWNRPSAEVEFLMQFARGVIARHGESYLRRGIRVRYLGRIDQRLPASLRSEMTAIQERTRGNSSLNLTFAFNFGGRSEIVDACRRLIESGHLPEEIDERVFAEHRQFAEMPDPDLIIRTGGDQRLSNFMLWGAAYAELLFLDVRWPEFGEVHFAQALDIFAARTRRYGAIDEPEAASA